MKWWRFQHGALSCWISFKLGQFHWAHWVIKARKFVSAADCCCKFKSRPGSVDKGRRRKAAQEETAFSSDCLFRKWKQSSSRGRLLYHHTNQILSWLDTVNIKPLLKSTVRLSQIEIIAIASIINQISNSMQIFTFLRISHHLNLNGVKSLCCKIISIKS